MEIEYTKKNIQGILERLYHFEKVKESGNVNAIVVLVDLEEALKKVKFTELQKRIFHYIYILQYTPDETAKKIGISRPNIYEYQDLMINKIYKVINGEGAK